MVAGTLILCGTPIGNLGDAAPRVAEALSSAAVVYAEDTRRSRVLLSALGVDRPIRSYFVGNERARSRELRDRLERGEVVALVTDAGMPAVSDPGVSAVAAARAAGATVTVVPGPSAVTVALALSGMPADRFVFEGFLSRSGGDRSRRLAEIAVESRTVVLFSSPHRVETDLADLARTSGPERQVFIGRELTKLHEEAWWGTLGAAADEWGRRSPQGEFTLVLAGTADREVSLDAGVAEVRRLVEEGVPASEAVRRVADATGVRRRSLYQAAITEDD
ncbi:MAG: 16S rRNA (cytidine(1402)-2'-O)-methyltransferase [Acidimicrobiia bacterium]|jgi:16S rRNA (cytidine1402-2'-O)-methyltransferase